MAAVFVNGAGDGLVLDRVTVDYGGIRALDAVSLEIPLATVVGLIGPNGAGKTTLINAVTGILRPASGTVSLGKMRLDLLSQHRVARAGVARTYQNIRLFGALSVADNVRAGAYRRRGTLPDDAVRELLTRATVQVARLPRDVRIEIEAIAVVPEK